MQFITKFIKYYSFFLLVNFYTSPFLEAYVDLKDGIEATEKMRAAVFEKVFDNGFKLLFFEKDDVPHVFLRLSFKVGARNEHSEKTYGYAHLLEHMAFKGTTSEGLNLSETDVDALAATCNLGSIGSAYNASTSYDSTNYYFAADKTNWPIFVEVLADMMQHLRVAPDHLASEMKAVYQEIKASSLDGAGNIFGALLPGNHPYHHPVIGFKENVLTADADDVRAFYQKHYTPDKAALIVVGNVDRDELIARVEKCFASASNTSGSSDAHEKNSSEATCDQASLYADFSQKNSIVYKTIPHSIVRHCWIIPGANNPVDDIKASVIEFVLNDRLKHILYDQQKLVMAIGVAKVPCLLHSFFFIMYMPQELSSGGTSENNGTTPSLHGDALMQQCQALVEKEIRNIINEGITEDEFDRYKKKSMNSFLESVERCEGVAALLQDSFMHNESANDRFRYFDLLNTLTRDDLQAFTYTFIRPFLMNTIIEKPVPDDEQQNWINLRARVDSYDAQLLASSVRKTEVEQPRFATTVGPIHPLPYVVDVPDEVVTLKNGMTVYLKKKGAIPFINIFCGFNDPEKLLLLYGTAKKRDIPNFAMSQLLEGSEGFTKKEHTDFLDQYGAQCSISHKGMHVRCLRSDVDVVSARAFHILAKPTYPDEVMQRDLSHAIELVKMVQKSPYVKASTLLLRYVCAGYPWIMQSEDEEIATLQSYTRDDCSTFHKEYVNAGNMFMVVVGDFQTDALIESLEVSFGKLPRGTAQGTALEIPDITNPARSELRAFLPEDQTVIGAARVMGCVDDKDMIALELLENYTRKMLFDIRQRTGIFYSISCSLLSMASSRVKGMGCFLTQVAKQHTPFANAIIKQVFTDISEKGISQKDLDEAKNTYQNTLAHSGTTQASLTSFYANLIGKGRSFDYYQHKLERIQALTLEEVNEVARRYFDPATWTSVEVGRIE